MQQSQLMLHRGAVAVDRDALAQVAAPPPEGRWFPVKHTQVLETVGGLLEAAGYVIDREQLAVGRNGHRFFGVLDLRSHLAHGVTLAVGIRNSTDKSFPLGFVAGARVFVCDNLAFRSELLVRRKHTRHGESRFGNAIAAAVQSLQSFQETESERIRLLQRTEVSEAEASHCVLSALERGLITAPIVPKVWKEILNPSFDYGCDRLTLWGILQAFTTALSDRAKRTPNEYASLTIRLNHFLSPRPLPSSPAPIAA